MPKYTAVIDTDEPLGQFIEASLETHLKEVNASIEVQEVHNE